eukprot:CAMPEP_0198137722 /NCGR_PEP_ID=MMETSP1443-20131203/1178_1 /TAXON_ID=186043 /ORGANISM="Entomoneis sp., Strain CCMP2396" /LENGTH=622 /DNA_ID=CAMNT_0043799243 /DNA_START=89 /DNA_END=1957 /DNA_ORIENTATION=-
MGDNFWSAVCLLFLGAVGYWAYLSRDRLKKLKNTAPISMIRHEGFKPENPAKVLELSDSFRQRNKDMKMYSLGQYLGELQVNVLSNDIAMEDIPTIIREQIDAALTAALIKALGPAFGAAILPLLGVVPTEGTSGYMFSMISGALISKATGEVETNIDDRGCLPLTMGMLGNGADLFATADRKKGDAVDLSNPKPESPLGCCNVGETGYDPHYGMKHGAKDEENSDLESTKQLVPNPFIIEQHWDQAIEGMEELIRTSKGSYDPDSQSLGEPVLVNETLLPDLYTGSGNGRSTHTQREIVRHRLVCCILNRLGHNYHIAVQKLEGKTTPLKEFTVKMESNGPDISKPHEFVKALLDSGHTVVCCSRGAATTFGASFCVKNKDGEWYNIPLGFFFQSGYESKDGKPANFFLPHSGMDMDISGPLIGKRGDGSDSKCNIQYYLAIEGMAGWHSNHNADVPWIQAVELSPPLTKAEDILKVVTLCAVGALSLNYVSTDLELPNGGYGLTGVCNDTVAVIEIVLYGKTNVHPITYSGRYLMHTARYATRLLNAMSKDRSLRKETDCLKKLRSAMMKLPNDQSATPIMAKESLKRMLSMMPPYTHQITLEAQEIVQDMQKELEEFSK